MEYTPKETEIGGSTEIRLDKLSTLLASRDKNWGSMTEVEEREAGHGGT